MHYYPFNIADYRKDTMHLTPIEHYIYRALMDTYYLSEKPLSLDHDELMRTHCLRSADDMRALCAVLKDFFVMDETGYAHKRCDIEIEVFHTKSKNARESAKVRWDRIRCERIANAMPTQSEGNANQEPRTKNQEPLTTKSKSKSIALATRLPADWKPTNDDLEFCKTARPELNPFDVADGFVDYWIAQAGTRAKKIDWSATWRNWVRNQKRHQTTQPKQNDERMRIAKAIWGDQNERTDTIDGSAIRLD